MRRRILWVLMILAVAIFNTNILQAASQTGINQDDYGILKLQLIDEDTEEPVDGVFYVRFYDCSKEISPKYLGYSKTNENGFLRKKFEPGLYYLEMSSDTICTKYTYVSLSKKDAACNEAIRIFPGKITEVIKKVKRGGKLKIRLVDQNGLSVNPKEDFNKNAGISIILFNSSVDITTKKIRSNEEISDLNDGEYLLCGLYPEIVDILIEFKYMGYGRIRKNNIEIKKNQVTDVIVIIDKNNQTGIEGKVTDTHGNPIKDVCLGVTGPITVTKGIYTNSNGYYKIIGLTEGKYELEITKDIADGIYFYDLLFDIVVKDNSLTRKDLVINLDYK